MGQGAGVVVGPEVSRGVLDAETVFQPAVDVLQVAGHVLAEVGDLLGQQASHLHAEATEGADHGQHYEGRARTPTEARPFQPVDGRFKGERDKERHQQDQQQGPQ